MLRYLDKLDDRLYRRITEKKIQLDYSGKLTDENLDRIEKQIEVEYIYNTNKIEGNVLTRGETLRILRGMTVAGKPLADKQEVKNHPAAIQLIKDLAFSKRNITEQDILDLHRISTTEVMSDAGKYRQDDITVREASFTPSPWYEISSDINELLDFVNNNPDGLVPVELAAHTHFWFVHIHPFHDGNGRMARLLTNFVLLRNHYPFIIFRKVERNQYIDALHKADDGYFKPFLVYVARLLEQMLGTYLSDSKPELLTLSELAEGTPYSAKYLGLLAGKGVIDAMKEGKTWKTTKQIIDSYIEQRGRKRKPTIP